MGKEYEPALEGGPSDSFPLGDSQAFPTSPTQSPLVLLYPQPLLFLMGSMLFFVSLKVVIGSPGCRKVVRKVQYTDSDVAGLYWLEQIIQQHFMFSLYFLFSFFNCL